MPDPRANFEHSGDLLIRGARIVPVHQPGGALPAAPSTTPKAAPSPAPSAEPVDVLLRSGRVMAIGPGLPDDGLPVVNADGRWLAPGLWDHHVHLVQWSRTLGWLDLSGTVSADEVAARVAAALPGAAGPVLTGFGYRSATWPQPASVAQLDAVSGSRPVVLISGDAHNGWLNSAALALLGLPPREGALEEFEWFPVFGRLEALPRDAHADGAAYDHALRQAAATGIVGVTDLEFGRGFHDWAERAGRGVVPPLRVRAATYAESLDECIAAGLRTGDPLVTQGPAATRLTMGPLKVISDGSLNTRTAYCHQPYADDPTSRGALNVAPDALRELLAQAHAHGIRSAVHAIGDAAVESALDAFAATEAHGSIEHAQLMTARDIARMSSLPVVASVQPAHLLDDRDVTAQCWPDRADRCFPLQSLVAAGVRLALGSDAPVAPLDPWLAMAAAVHRSADGRPAWNPAEALSPSQALAASTDGQGTVVVGSPGDLILLDADPRGGAGAGEGPPLDSAAAARRLREIDVALTVVGGVVTHAAATLAAP